MPQILPFGYKSARFIARPPEEDAKINILTGAIRSAKTFSVNAKLLKILAKGYWPGGVGLITGNSRGTAKTNIVDYLTDWAGSQRSHYSVGNGDLTLFGRKFKVLGAGDEQAFKAIKGATVGIWIADEATLYPQSFWDMATSRLSLPGSRCYATTNPGSPYHYLKKDWLDNQELIDNKIVWSDTFTLPDNPNIEEKIKEGYKITYTGVFYQRNILGMWVIAEGAVYRDVLSTSTWYNDSTRPVALLSQNGHVDRFVGIDFGTINATSMVDFYDDGKVLWVEREYYWDSVKENRQKTNAEYANDFLQTFCKDSNPMRWPIAIVDPSAASFKAELTKMGVVVTDADNDVMEGIRKVSSMLGKKALRIHERCVNLKRELETYSWDEKASKMGVEKPIKQMDHSCFVAGTKIRTIKGQTLIEDLLVGDYVVTPLGIAKVLDITQMENQSTVAWNSTYVTPEHPVATDKNYTRVDALRYTNNICKWRQLYLKALNLEDILSLSVAQIGIILDRVAVILKKGIKHTIKRFGRQYMVQYLKGMMYTIGTRIQAIMTFPIWNCFPSTIMGIYMERKSYQTLDILQVSDHLLRNGTLQKRVLSGIDRMEKIPTQKENLKSIVVPGVKQSLNLLDLVKMAICFVLINASRLGVVNQVWMMSPELARYVARVLSLTNTQNQSPVVENVGPISTVYAVKTEHGCYFANDVLVSNCDACRYGVQTKISDYRLAT